jgi:hypothetical protein
MMTFLFRYHKHAYEHTIGTALVEYVKGTVNMKDGKLKVHNKGLSFDFDQGYAFSETHGTYMWSMKVTDLCERKNQYFAAEAEVRTLNNNKTDDLSGAFVTLQTPDKRRMSTFLTTPIQVCGKVCYGVQT